MSTDPFDDKLAQWQAWCDVTVLDPAPSWLAEARRPSPRPGAR